MFALFLQNISVSLLISDVFSAGSSAAKIPEITAAPLTPLPSSLDTFSLLIPPIATTGIFTEAAIFLSSSIERFFASFWSYFQKPLLSRYNLLLLFRQPLPAPPFWLSFRGSYPTPELHVYLCLYVRLSDMHSVCIHFHCNLHTVIYHKRNFVAAAEFLKFYCFFSGFFRIQFFSRS